VAKRRRREQQHLRQQGGRRRQYDFGGTQPAAKYKPEFPFNLFQNTKVFYILGLAIMVGGVVVAAVVGGTSGSRGQPVDLPTNTPQATADPNQTAVATSTPSTTRNFPGGPQDVIDEEKNTYRATLRTQKGEIVIELFADIAPKTVNSFVFLAKNGYFDGLTFHRVQANFVIQGGDPRGDGTGGPGYTVEEEPNDLENERGTVAMAKAAGATAFGSQFFINLRDNTTLDQPGNRFYPFGRVVQGMDVVDRIERGDVIQQVIITETPK
jgi:peptidyl-prolyl cis-trans isomerase B (cyclophilin B)